MEQENFKQKIDDICYSIKAVHKFLDEDGKKKVGNATVGVAAQGCQKRGGRKEVTQREVAEKR